MRRVVLIALPAVGAVVLRAGRPWLGLGILVAWGIAVALLLLRTWVLQIASVNRRMAGALEAIADRQDGTTSRREPTARGRHPAEAPDRARR